ncbi:MAG: DUF1236 domain-containing protein [Pseudolabrys sp.]|nr:DUF1236 domain-containing protein [Pseudolabrys sp.]
MRLGTDVEGRVSINAAQARDMSTALRSGGAHPIEGVDITIKAGTVVPAAVHLTVVSPAIVEVFPQFRGYSYFTTREEVVIVEPASKKIVALVPLKETVTASKPSNAKTARASNGERVVTRRAERERVTTGVSLRDDGGDLPPPGMVLRETTVTTANGTRTYRRLEPAGNAVVIRRRARTFDFDTDY